MDADLIVAKGIVSSMGDPAILLDRDLRHVCHSLAYAALTGLRPRQLARKLDAGDSPFEILGGDPAVDEANARSCLESGKAMQLAEQTITDGLGTELTVYLNYVPVLDSKGAVIAIMQVLRDVSAEARVQVRYREMLDQERLRAESLEREVEKRTQDLTAALAEVTRLSRIDPLTSLLNRRAFTELAEQSLKMARRHKRSMALLIGDLDYFKRINDDHGHQAGDKLLVASAQALKDSVRETDPVARFGGEEFIVLLTETQMEAVQVVGERIRASVESIDPGDVGEGVPTPTISVGVAIYPDHGETLDDLVSHADQALYRAKDGGRNQVVVYQPDVFVEDAPTAKPSRRRVLVAGSSPAGELERAIDGEFEITSTALDAQAIALCEREGFDVIIANHAKAEDGVDFLRRSLRYRPDSLRLLVVDSQELFLDIRGANLARVDSYLLRVEAAGNVRAAIEDGLARRELDRQKMLLASDSVHRIFTSRLAELDVLIEQRAFEFAFQPIVDPRSRKVYAYEALCRANHPVFCNATVLFEAALQSGSLWQLGRVTRKLAAEGVHDLPPDVKVFVNLHPGEVDDPALLAEADSATAERVVFEITERAAIPDLRRFRETARKLASHGYQFAIDDLGAGYASLNAVALLAPEYIKIDMMMIRGIDQAPRRAQLIRRMVDFADDIGIRLIAEGVETADEARTVAELGCHLAQGFYYGRPTRR